MTHTRNKLIFLLLAVYCLLVGHSLAADANRPLLEQPLTATNEWQLNGSNYQALTRIADHLQGKDSPAFKLNFTHAVAINKDSIFAKIAKEMVYIPSGQFQMGDLQSAGDLNEIPVHTVNIEPFYIARHETTFAEWDLCVADGGCNHIPKDKGWGRGDRPVIHVSWMDIQVYIDWLRSETGIAYRLPSEAEWEYAARGGSPRQYSFGNRAMDLDDYAWHWYNAERKTQSVGTRKANAYGLHDFHGNVFEWVADCFNASYQGAPTTSNPWTSGDCSKRMLRGGSWFNDPLILRSSYRNHNSIRARFKNFGFRLARDEQES